MQPCGVSADSEPRARAHRARLPHWAAVFPSGGTASIQKTLLCQSLDRITRVPLWAAPATLAAGLRRAWGLLLVAVLGGCAALPPAGLRFERHSAPAAAGSCAWYGDSDGRTLWFGESAFWASKRRAPDDPTADLRVSGPGRIGRFDLTTRSMEPPLEVAVPAGAGVWDVLYRRGRIYFTTFFGSSGFVDADSGALTVFEGLGTGLNELAPGPGSTLLASRYGSADGGPGSVVIFGTDGTLVAEYPLAAPEGIVAAPKTVAFDPVRREIWATVDLVARDGGPTRTDARRLAADGRELQRIAEPEIQFVSFDAEGTGYLAARAGRVLSLLVLETQAMRADPLVAARRIPLDDDFDPAFDFVQDIHRAQDGRLVVTRWSGKLHVVEPASSRVESVKFPREGGKGLYYSGVLSSGSLCATLCAGVEVVCTKAP